MADSNCCQGKSHVGETQELNRKSSREECLFMWLIKVLNLAQVTRPLPLKVVEALQKRWFSHGLIQSAKTSHPFSLDSLLSTFLISNYAK